MDDADVLEFFAANSGKETDEFVRAVLGNTSFWGVDLGAELEAEKMVASCLKDIRELGMRGALEKNFT